MADAKHFCPECGCPDLVLEKESPIVLSSGTRKAHCPLCGWTGNTSDTLGAITKEQFYTTEKLANAALRVVGTHAAGPLYQLFVWAGLVDPENKAAVNHVMRAAFEGMIMYAFNAAAEVADPEALAAIEAADVDAHEDEEKVEDYGEDEDDGSVN